MAWLTGRRMGLSLNRRFIGDLLYFSRRMPIVTFERRMDLGVVAAARQRLDRPPAWTVLFTKACAIVAARRPELRRTYLPLPWPHLWQADESVVSIAFERDYQGEPAVFFGLIKSPDRRPLGEMAALLEDWKGQALSDLAICRRMFRYARLPLPVRRLLWWYALSWSGRLKGRNFGTSGVSLTGHAGATALNLICPLTTSLSWGVMSPDGSVAVRLHFDHRVMDGMPAARALAQIEDVLRNEIAGELHALADHSAEGTPVAAGAGPHAEQ